MINLIQRHQRLFEYSGVVLALNARQLVKNVHCFDRFLNAVENSQLLVWTGTGEPAISKGQISYIQKHFHTVLGKSVCEERIGFDCVVSHCQVYLYSIFNLKYICLYCVIIRCN